MNTKITIQTDEAELDQWKEVSLPWPCFLNEKGDKGIAIENPQNPATICFLSLDGKMAPFLEKHMVTPVSGDRVTVVFENRKKGG